MKTSDQERLQAKGASLEGDGLRSRESFLFDMCDEYVTDLVIPKAGEFSLFWPAASSSDFVKTRDRQGGGDLEGPDPAGCG